MTMKQFFTSHSIIIWSLVISTLVMVASMLGLLWPGAYLHETTNWAVQAKGQDLGNLFAVVTLLASGYLYSKGSFKASLVWLGTLFYLVYAYIVYAMAVHFSILFLIYIAILGLSTYASIFNLGHIKSIKTAFPSGSARKIASLALIVIGILFGLLWLSELIPAILTGNVPQSVKDAGLWVNPIHVIDLSVVLPAFIITGYLARKNDKNGLLFIAPWLTFSVIMGISIIAGMVIMVSEGYSNAIPPMVMVSAVVVYSLFALWRYLRKIA